MNGENRALIISLIDLILEYGPSAAISMIKALETNNPTPEQIRNLRVEAPESYFEGQNAT